MPATVRLLFSGDSPQALGEALLRAAALSRGETDADVSEPGAKTRLRVIVTNPRGPRGFESAVDYALGEVRAGIATAGGSLGDGCHVEIQWLGGPLPAADRGGPGSG